jgi:DNA-binding transcriptional LysR family regulator
MEDLNDLAYFAKVVECRGFSAAGKQLGIPKSRLSRRISLLEDRLGIRLLQRSSRRLVLTSIGEQFYERCRAVVAMGVSAREVVDEAIAEPKGDVRMSCPITLSQFWLNPLLPDFMNAFPKVRLEVMVTNRRIDPYEDQVDVALRVRRPPFDDSALVVRRIGRTTDVVVASPAFLAARSTPTAPGDLAGWPTLALPAPGHHHMWTLQNGTASAQVVHTPRLVTDDMLALKRAALDGVGASLLPEIICRDELKSGDLRLVLPGWSCAMSDIQAVFPSRRNMAPAVRALLDFLASRHLN